MQMFCKEGEVVTCQAQECSYNDREVCHAPKIRVGGSHAACDTYTTAGAIDKGDDTGSVGSCDLMQCVFNDGRRCNASGVTIAQHEQHADCMTYRA